MAEQERSASVRIHVKTVKKKVVSPVSPAIIVLCVHDDYKVGIDVHPPA